MRDAELVGQPECQKAGRRGDGDILLASHHIGHGRCSKRFVRRPMPHGFSGPGIQGGEHTAVLTDEDEPAIRGKCSTVCDASCLIVFPDGFTGLDIQCADRPSTAGYSGVRAVKESFTHFKGRRYHASDRTHITCGKEEQLKEWVVGCRHPVGSRLRANECSINRRVLIRQQYWLSIGVVAARPSAILNERFSEKQLSVGSVKNVEKAVSVGLHQQLTRLTSELFINEH